MCEGALKHRHALTHGIDIEIAGRWLHFFESSAGDFRPSHGRLDTIGDVASPCECSYFVLRQLYVNNDSN